MKPIKIGYTKEVEELMKKHHKGLNEIDKRLYVGMETLKLGYGGKQYIRKLFKCGINTVVRGIQEVKHGTNLGKNKIRKEGGGRSKILNIKPKITENFDKIIENYTAGSPVDDGIVWTNLIPREIKEKLEEEYETTTSIYIIKKIIKSKGMKKRKLYKGETLKSVEGRNEQFENIAKLKNEAKKKGNPTLSIDTKKKN